MFRWWVESPVVACLLPDVLVELAPCLYRWVVPIVCDKGCRHMIEGHSARIHGDLVSGSTFPKVTLPCCMHESTAEAYLDRFVGGVQIGVLEVFDPGEELQPLIPAASVLGVSSVSKPSVLGFSCFSFKIQAISLSGTVTIYIMLGESKW